MTMKALLMILTLICWVVSIAGIFIYDDPIKLIQCLIVLTLGWIFALHIEIHELKDKIK